MDAEFWRDGRRGSRVYVRENARESRPGQRLVDLFLADGDRLRAGLFCVREDGGLESGIERLAGKNAGNIPVVWVQVRSTLANDDCGYRSS